ncbi:MAG: iron-containing alcohol dehydrogenase [Chloroflexi bacterium]|nr:iron-containing alcohol dehydrogenase [Chloroflexota bacterium]
MTGTRGWIGMENSRPARDVELRYGHGLLREESEKWPRYAVVATKTAWKATQPYLVNQPTGIGIVTHLDWDHLEDTTQSLPDDIDLVVGIGGGTALDASKYVAIKKDVPLILVPTIVSTGAIIHGVFAKWKGRNAVPPVSEWPYCNFEHALIDYDLVREAPANLSVAGLGDVLCGFAGIAEWRYAAERGLAPTDYQDTVSPILGYFESLASEFPKTLDDAGGLTDESVKFIMTAIHERDDRMLRSEHAPGADHVFPITLENVANRGFIHGELCALGALIVAWKVGQPDELIDWLDRAQVRYTPAQMGMTRDELKAAIDALPADLDSREVNSVLNREPITSSEFDDLWEYLAAI